MNLAGDACGAQPPPGPAIPNNNWKEELHSCPLDKEGGQLSSRWEKNGSPRRHWEVGGFTFIPFSPVSPPARCLPNTESPQGRMD